MTSFHSVIFGFFPFMCNDQNQTVTGCGGGDGLFLLCRFVFESKKNAINIDSIRFFFFQIIEQI